jgi:branched-chain amino acid transport system ATP-binding protein
LDRGELIGFIGPNGAGKTTVMRVIAGLIKPTAGSVYLNGKRLDGMPIHERVRSGLGLAQQIVKPLRSLSVLANVTLAAGHGKTRQPWRALFRFRQAEERDRAHKLLDLVGIDHLAEQFPLDLPLGYRKRLELARALALDPCLLLLDEPLAGLNKTEAAAMADTIAGLNRGGLGIVLSEHNLGEVLRICPRLVVQDNGRKIADGETRTVMSDRRVRAAYLGEE